MIWLASLQGKIVTVAAALMAVWGWFKLHDSKVVKQERDRVETVGKQIDAKAQTARRRATSDADRVLPKYYRD